MTKYIKMFNVGFGNCFAIRDSASSFLIDCGSMTPKKVNKKTMSSIQSLIRRGKERHFLITHFHKDHVSLIKQLPNSLFDVIYLRNVYRNKTTYSITLLQYLLFRFLKGKEQYDSALLALFSTYRLQRLLKRGGKFTFVRKGSSFSLGSTSYYVSSPWDPMLPPHDPHPFYQHLNQLLPCENDIGILERFGAEMSERFGHADQINQDSLNDGSLKKDYESAEKAIQRIGKNYKKSNNKREIKKLAREELAKTPNWEHKNNIVFGDLYARLLMCGDEEAKDMREILFDYQNCYPFFEQIHCIQVPHHGTPSHYVPFGIFKPDIALISNGNYQNYQKPDCHYLSDFKTILDTNHNMKILHGNCPYLHGKNHHKYVTAKGRTKIGF